MKETKQKIVKTNLKTLLKRYSRSDALNNLEASYNQETIHKILVKDIVDSRYLKKVELSEEQIDEVLPMVNKRTYTPILVRTIENEKYEIIIGRQAYFAAKKAGVETLDCLVKNYSDEEALIISATYIQGLKRGHVVDQSYICNELKKEFHYKNKELCLFFKQSPSQISNILKLSELSPKVLRLILNETISYGHAKAFARLNSEQIDYVVEEIKKNNLSVRETERLVNSISTNQNFNPNLVVTKLGITLKFNSQESKEKALVKIEKLIKKGKIKF